MRMPWTKPYTPSRNQRLSPEAYADASTVCFITIRSYGTSSPFLSATLNQMVLQILKEESACSNLVVYTYCLMPDHLHFLIKPRQDGVSVIRFAERFKGKSTNRSWPLGWQGKLWQPRSYDHLVRSNESLAAIAEYILNNPVRKGLVQQAADWEWSGQMNPLPIEFT